MKRVKTNKGKCERKGIKGKERREFKAKGSNKCTIGKNKEGAPGVEN
jgi:hypothetical protein